jgi:glucosyl-dolichyl phosphate glucuronosyltransferase
MTKGAVPYISVAIATKNRVGLLSETLFGLMAQRWPRDRFEIIVADNGSTDSTRAVVERAARIGLPRICYRYVPEPGKSRALNVALSVCLGTIIALTDDDVTPDPDWLAQLAGAFTETNADFVAGRILPKWESAPPVWLSPRMYGALAIPDNGTEPATLDGVSSSIMPIGANMAVRHAALTRVGGFRTDLGKLEGTLRTGEDHEFYLRLLAAGFIGTYEPTAIVHHFVPDARLRPEYFRKWLYQNGRDVCRLEASFERPGPRLLGVPRYLWRDSAQAAAEACRATLAGDPADRFASALRVLWFGGYVREAWFGSHA